MQNTITYSLSKNANLNYVATIVKVDTFIDHPSADRLKLAVVNGYTISVSIDTEPGVFIYFPLESKLSDNFLSKNNLYRQSLNKNINPEKSGFFELSGRVKCVKLRGVYSEGFIIPPTALSIYGEIGELVPGTKFDTITVDGVSELLCQKYVIQTNTSYRSGAKGKSTRKYDEVIVPNQFRFHPDTPKLKDCLSQINPDDYIHISYKVHGTSAIFCNLLVNKELRWWEKLLLEFGLDLNVSEYKTFCASRKVVKDPDLNKGQINNYYDFDIWNAALEVVRPCLTNGMTIYAEIAGYLPSGNYIQKGYDYGCVFTDTKVKNENGELAPLVNYYKYTPTEMYKRNLFKIFVYRITQTSADGFVTEMSATDVQQYCKSHGLVPVPELWYGKVSEFIKNPDNWQFDFIQNLSTQYLEKDCTMCKNKVPAEGVVIRTMKPKFEAFKLKSQRFNERESKELDSGETNIEDNQ